MFNIEFGCSNSAQEAVGNFETMPGMRDTLYASVNDFPRLLVLLKDIREMPKEEYQKIQTNILTRLEF